MTQVSITDLVNGARAGCVVSFPTDTVPALAVLPEHADLIFALKQRSQNKPLILMGATADELWSFVKGTDQELVVWQQVASLYWPGAVTLVLPASDRVPRAMNPTDPTTIGLRVPLSAIAQHILSQTSPLATTSANLSGQETLTKMSEIDAQFVNILTLDCSQLAVESEIGIPSTVIKWTGTNWHTLRQGAVKVEF